MARFVFQLDGLLRHRKHLERQRQRDLAVAQKRMQDLQNGLHQLNQDVQQANEDLRRNHLLGPLDLSFLAAHRRFSIAIQRRAMALVQDMAAVQRQIEDARIALAEAARQRKIIEKLREKLYARWRAAMNKSETAQLDEISMQLSYWMEQQNQVENAEQPA